MLLCGIALSSLAGLANFDWYRWKIWTGFSPKHRSREELPHPFIRVSKHNVFRSHFTANNFPWVSMTFHEFPSVGFFFWRSYILDIPRPCVWARLRIYKRHAFLVSRTIKYFMNQTKSAGIFRRHRLGNRMRWSRSTFPDRRTSLVWILLSHLQQY
jgi:hypothetical protein